MMKKTKNKKVSSKKDKKKVSAVKKTVSIPINQLENLDAWLSVWKSTKKLPHNRIVCSVCKIDFIGLKGIGMSHAMKKFDGNIKRVLTESICKECRPKPVVEDKPKVVEFLSVEEMEARKDEIRKTLPKFNPNREPNIIDLSKDKDMCKKYTYFSCHRPDIYLDYGCDSCGLKKHCACPIKDVNRVADGRHKKKKK